MEMCIVQIGLFDILLCMFFFRLLRWTSCSVRMNSSPDAEWQVPQRMQSDGWIIDQETSFKIKRRACDISIASAIHFAMCRNQW